MASALPFDEWKVVVAERIALKASREREKAEAALAKKAAEQETANLAFSRWTVDKSVHDRALELLPAVSLQRAQDEAAWKEVGTVLAYVEHFVADTHKKLGSTVDFGKRSLEHVFMTWTRHNHSFDSVTISAALGKRFSAGSRAMFNEVDGGNLEITGLASIGITRGPDGMGRPLNSDEKLRNGIFNSMAKKCWQACIDGTREALAVAAGGDPVKRERIAMQRGLNRLAEMVEEDEDAVIKKKRSDLESRVATGKAGHARWLERKDMTRIRLPPETFKLVEESRAELDCSPYNPYSAKIIRKGPGPLPNNSAVVVRRMGVGLKTGFAHSVGDLDMQKARAALLCEGHVFLENFANEDGVIDDESRARYRAELATNEALRLRSHGEREKMARGQAHFIDWVRTKEASELAAECMSLMPVVLSTPAPAALPAPGGAASATAPPSAPAPMSAAAAAAAAAAALAEDRPLLGRPPSDDEYELWRAVGYACKAVDRTLAAQWMAWARPLFSRSDCMREWATFRPLAVVRADKEDKHEQENGRAGASDSKKGGDREIVREGGGAALVPFKAVHAPRSVTEDKWTAEDRSAALQLLRMLSVEHRRLNEFKVDAASETPPSVPVLRRKMEAEAMPAFLHGHEGSIARVQGELGLVDGLGVSMLAGSGVGSELVLQWFVGENDVDTPPPLGSAAVVAQRDSSVENSPRAPAIPGRGLVESSDKLLARLASAHSSKRAAAELPAPRQPPYVIVVETCGVAGGRRQREGEWTRVLIDPPEPMPILASSPGTTHVPVSALAQGLGRLPPPPGQTSAAWESDARRLRGCVRLSGLVPNTTYCYRLRAYNRIGASSYAFGAFTTALAPPPAPIVALPFLVPRSILSGAAADTALPEAGVPAGLGPSYTAVLPESLTLCWERRVDLRVHLLRLLRVFYIATTGGGGSGGVNGGGAARRRRSGVKGGEQPLHTHAERGEDGGEERFDDDEDADAAGGLFSSAAASHAALLAAVAQEAGLRNWLGGCVAAPDAWPLRAGGGQRPGIENEDERDASASAAAAARYHIAATRPVTVLEALLTDARESLSWSSVVALFGDDAETDDPLDLLLAGTPLAVEVLEPTNQPREYSGEPGAKAAHLGRRPFTLSSGALSMQSKLAAMTRRAQTLSRAQPMAPRPSTAGAGGRRGSASASSLAGAGHGFASTSASRPASAHTQHTQHTQLTASGRSGITALLAARRGSLGGGGGGGGGSVAGGSVHGGGATPAIVHSDAGARFSLLQSLSDGPKGQEWAEVYVGTRSLRRVDKLMAGTAYTFRVQAINADNQGSLFGPQAFVTTALASPANMHTLGRLAATSVHLAWDAVSGANALSTMRAISGESAGPDGDKGKAEAGGGADIDAVLAALLVKTRQGAAAALVAAQKAQARGADAAGDSKKSALATLLPPASTSVTALVPVREGDGGFGVDLGRVWARYDAMGSGAIPTDSLRGLLADLGAYVETSTLVMGGGDVAGGGLSAASVEGAASAGPGEWRFAAALARLDPGRSGRIAYQPFLDWWNSADAALEKANAVRGAVLGASSAGGETGSALGAGAAAASGGRPKSAGAASSAARAAFSIAIPGSPGAVTEGLGSAVVYVLEARRRLFPAELAAAAAAADAGFGAGGTRHGPSIGPARSVLNTVATALGAEPLPHSSLQSRFSPWTAVYIGPQTRFRATELLPNSDYQFRCTSVGRHAFSSASIPLTVVTPPLAPFAPVPVRVTPRACTVRFYPGEQGADKFEVQVRVVESMLPAGAVIHGHTDRLVAGVGGGLNTSRGGGARAAAASASGRLYTGRNTSESAMRRLATSRSDGGAAAAEAEEALAAANEEPDAELWPEAPGPDGWSTLFVGASTMTVLAGLSANTVYRCRAVAYNTAGVASRPSVESQFVTPDGAQAEALTPANAGRHFVVECGAVALSGGGRSPLPAPVVQDVVAGDTLLFTEDVFVDSGPDPDPYHPAARREVSQGHPRAHFLCSRTIAASVIGDSASRVTTGTGASANLGAPGGPVFVGAAAAAHAAHASATHSDDDAKSFVSTRTGTVLKFASSRPASAASRSHAAASADEAGGASAVSVTEAARHRVLSLQVEWSTLSIARAGTYMLPMGAIIKRRQDAISQLDVFRVLWADEAGRWSCLEELRASFDEHE